MTSESFPIYESKRDGHLISTDKTLLDINLIHTYLADESYWSQGIARGTIERFIQHSLCFGVYALRNQMHTQVGFARIVSDYTTFAWLADVFIIPSAQGHGLGKWLIENVLLHPELQQLRRVMLATRDAHGLYQKYGFHALEQPDQHLILRPAPAS